VSRRKKDTKILTRKDTESNNNYFLTSVATTINPVLKKLLIFISSCDNIYPCEEFVAIRDAMT